MTVSQDILHPQPRRVVNLKAVGICGVVIVTASLGMQRLHSQQVVKTTAYLKQAADEAVLHREPKEAIQALERYLTFSQGDGAARQKLSELLCDNAADEETLRTAYAMNEAVLLDDNDNTQLRLRQTDLAVRLKIFSDADFHLTILQKTLQDDPRVWHLSGLVAEHEDDTSEAIRCFRLAIENNSSDGETCTRLARLLADEGQTLLR